MLFAGTTNPCQHLRPILTGSIDMNAFTLIIEDYSSAGESAKRIDKSSTANTACSPNNETLADFNAADGEKSANSNEISHVTHQDPGEHTTAGPRTQPNAQWTYGVWDLLSCR